MQHPSERDTWRPASTLNTDGHFVVGVFLAAIFGVSWFAPNLALIVLLLVLYVGACITAVALLDLAFTSLRFKLRRRKSWRDVQRS